MRTLTVIVGVLCAALICLTYLGYHDSAVYLAEQQRAADRFNWAMQGQDAAIKGCPGQYSQYADPEPGQHFLIGCWGKR